jgi:hypothetical protein
LITADKDATSDATFPNVSRSTGTFYIVATQGIMALEQAVGQHATQNFMNNMRNKIFLQIEEPATMNFAKELAGKALRFYSFDQNSHESYESMRREVGFDPALLGAAKLTNGLKEAAGLMLGMFNFRKSYQFDGMRKKFEIDNSFIPSSSPFLTQQAGGNSLQEQKSAAWRAEDKNQEYMKSGNEMTDILSSSDMIQMGRTHAYAFIYRGGHSRQDIIKLRGINEVLPDLLKQ